MLRHADSLPRRRLARGRHRRRRRESAGTQLAYRYFSIHTLALPEIVLVRTPMFECGRSARSKFRSTPILCGSPARASRVRVRQVDGEALMSVKSYAIRVSWAVIVSFLGAAATVIVLSDSRPIRMVVPLRRAARWSGARGLSSRGPALEARIVTPSRGRRG